MHKSERERMKIPNCFPCERNLDLEVKVVMFVFWQRNIIWAKEKYLLHENFSKILAGVFKTWETMQYAFKYSKEFCYIFTLKRILFKKQCKIEMQHCRTIFVSNSWTISWLFRLALFERKKNFASSNCVGIPFPIFGCDVL